MRTLKKLFFLLLIIFIITPIAIKAVAVDNPGEKLMGKRMVFFARPVLRTFWGNARSIFWGAYDASLYCPLPLPVIIPEILCPEPYFAIKHAMTYVVRPDINYLLSAPVIMGAIEGKAEAWKNENGSLKEYLEDHGVYCFPDLPHCGVDSITWEKLFRKAFHVFRTMKPFDLSVLACRVLYPAFNFDASFTRKKVKNCPFGKKVWCEGHCFSYENELVHAEKTLKAAIIASGFLAKYREIVSVASDLTGMAVMEPTSQWMRGMVESAKEDIRSFALKTGMYSSVQFSPVNNVYGDISHHFFPFQEKLLHFILKEDVDGLKSFLAHDPISQDIAAFLACTPGVHGRYPDHRDFSSDLFSPYKDISIQKFISSKFFKTHLSKEVQDRIHRAAAILDVNYKAPYGDPSGFYFYIPEGDSIDSVFFDKTIEGPVCLHIF